MTGTRAPADPGTTAAPPSRWESFGSAPVLVRLYLVAAGVLALTLPFCMRGIDPSGASPSHVLTASVLVLISVVNVEMGRRLSGGLAHVNQPHKALSAWAFATALLLPTPWLLVVVPLTFAHARWRGRRIPVWKWVGSGTFLVLSALAAAAARHLTMGEQTNWMLGNGGRGILAMVSAAAAFLAVESLLSAGSALLDRAGEQVWWRRLLAGRSFYAREAGGLLIGGLLSAVWTGGAWFVLFFLPIYVLAQRAALHGPLRDRAEAAAELAARNRELELANQFKIDLMGFLGHEIGNPLSVILLHAELGADSLADDESTLDARRSLMVVERNAMQIRRVLHDLVVLVSSDRGALRAHPEPTAVRPHLTLAADSQPPGARPDVECPPDLQALVQPGHLDQMLANLLGNAAKYAEGATALTARPVEGGLVEIIVSDAGPGVPRGFRRRLFERFSREAESAGTVLGTGLGLFITRELARANGGDVVHRPAHPQGSHFVIQLRQASAHG